MYWYRFLQNVQAEPKKGPRVCLTNSGTTAAILKFVGMLCVTVLLATQKRKRK